MYGFCTPFDDISRLLTLFHGMSRCLTLSTVYVRQLAVSVHNFAVSVTQMCPISEPRMKRSWIRVFFIHPCWPSPSSICSVALLLLHHCRRRLWIVLHRLFLQRGCGTITHTSNAGLLLADACSWQSIDELLLWNLVSWQKRRESKKKKPQRSRYMKEKFSDFLFAEGLEKRKVKAKKKPQRSRYKDEIPDFLFRTCMSNVRNTGMLSLYLA